MPKIKFSKRAFELLDGIEANNNKAWFDEHRAEIKTALQEPFAELLETITAKLKSTALPLRGDKKSMFRMNRDVRFSSNKDPYKPSVSGVLTLAGDKKSPGGLLYLHMGTDGGMIAAGFHQLPMPELTAFREAIIENDTEFARIAKGLAKRELPLTTENSLKSMPRGFSEYAEHPLAEFLQMKGYTVHRSQTKTAWLGGSIFDNTIKLARDVKALLEFGNAALRVDARKYS